MFNVPVDS